MVRIVSKPPTEKEVILLSGFPGAGLVGSIALQYLVEDGKYQQIGSITSRFLPQISLATNGVAQSPIRLYENGGVIAVVSDVPIPPQLSYDIAAELLTWLSDHAVITEVVVLGGLTTGGEGERVFGVATTKEGVKKFDSSVEVLPALSIAGVSGSLLIEAQLRDIPGRGFMIETNYNVDPRAAAAALVALNMRYGLSIDTASLLEQAEEVESMMHQLAEDVLEQEQSESKPISVGEQMMYG